MTRRRGPESAAAERRSSLRRETADALRALGFRPRRRFGQSFLVDRTFVDRIVAAARPEGEAVLEIGPGLGALSEALADRAERLVCIEIDAALAGRLSERLRERTNVEVIEGDALDSDWARLLPRGRRSIVVGNLPYRVGTGMLLRMLDERRLFSRLVLMLQREVAARIVAAPATREYGSLTVWTELYGEARILFHVPAGAFVPRPKVESSVVSIELRDEPRVFLRDRERFERILRASFGQRRKTLGRALRGLVARPQFERAAIDPGRRGETLSLDEFARLSDARAS